MYVYNKREFLFSSETRSREFESSRSDVSIAQSKIQRETSNANYYKRYACLTLHVSYDLYQVDTPGLFDLSERRALSRTRSFLRERHANSSASLRISCSRFSISRARVRICPRVASSPVVVTSHIRRRRDRAENRSRWDLGKYDFPTVANCILSSKLPRIAPKAHRLV